VDLLNASIYNKAEQYKEKVMTRLLDKTNITGGHAATSHYTFNND